MAYASFEVVARAALAQSETLVPAWLPNGQREGDEWVVLNPNRDDRSKGSFKTNLTTGLWADFAGDGSRKITGKDLIALFAYLNDLPNGKACAALARQLGVAPPPPAAKADNSKHVSPVPDSAPEPPAKHPIHGKPTAQWVYRDPDGQLLFYVRRLIKADGEKSYSPVTLWLNQDTGSLFWRHAKAPDPQPLYGLDRLYNRPDAPVCLCEGEKAADAAARLLPDFVTTTSPNGSSNAHKADWQHLKGRQVTIWPDADKAGKGYAATVTAILKALGVDAKTAPILEGVEAGFDAADAEKDGWTQQQAADYLATAQTLTVDAKPEKPRPGQPLQDAGSLTGMIQREATWQLEAGRLPEAADYAEQVLIRNQAGIYQRGYLCRITTQAQPTVRGIERPAGAIAIATVDPHHLHEQLDRYIQWQRWNRKREEYQDTDAPMILAHRLIARAGFWRFPVLTGVITAPTIRPDGSLLQQPGYDAKTGLFFDPQGETFTPIPDSPTQADGRAALDLLIREVLSSRCDSDPDQTGFAFTSPTARSAALSAILTALIRHSLRTAPLHLISATHAGSGKSLLADVAALIATGRPATIFDLGDDDDEQEKRLLSILLSGDQVVNLDNLERPLGGGHINKVLTQETFTGRVLGQSRNATAPTTTTWLATGNNAGVSEDMTRRVVLCELDPQVEAPQDRQFSRDLHSWIPANRPALVAAALTAIRAYVVAGKPKQAQLPIMGSFEDYHHAVRSALVWLGEADPLGDTGKMQDNDPTRIRLRALLAAWFGAFGSVPTTAKEAVARANSVLRDETGSEVPHDPILREVLQDHFSDSRRGGISARYLGDFLSKFKGRIENGARFEKYGDYQRAIQWRVFITNKTRFDASSCESGESRESLLPHTRSESLSPKPKPVAAQTAGAQRNHFSVGLGENDSPDSPDSPNRQNQAAAPAGFAADPATGFEVL